jgi:hypothetical protein
MKASSGMAFWESPQPSRATPKGGPMVRVSSLFGQILQLFPHPDSRRAVTKTRGAMKPRLFLEHDGHLPTYAHGTEGSVSN